MHLEMHKFSIITSLYNSQKFINDYFDTVFSQEVLADEIILIDDTNNQENLEEVIKEKILFYKFKNIKLIKNEINKGPAISYNKALKLSSNNLIFRLDVDDFWKPNHTKIMLDIYDKDNSYLIYAVSLKKNNFLTNLKCDVFLINENHFIHSSWLINMNICKTFRYHMLFPSVALEDYFTLLYYKYKKFNFFYTYQQSVVYKVASGSHGHKYNKNKKYLRIRKLISILFLKIYLDKQKNFFNKVNFLIFKYGFIKFLVLQFWILDKIFLRRLLK
jgi:glycosyltransferase involved in cell wall biosynthesis